MQIRKRVHILENCCRVCFPLFLTNFPQVTAYTTTHPFTSVAPNGLECKSWENWCWRHKQNLFLGSTSQPCFLFTLGGFWAWGLLQPFRPGQNQDCISLCIKIWGTLIQNIAFQQFSSKYLLWYRIKTLTIYITPKNNNPTYHWHEKIPSVRSVRQSHVQCALPDSPATTGA